MAKYRKPPVVIEAEQYSAGMEDGFSCIPLVSMCKWSDENGCFKHCQVCTLNIPKVPFIATSEGNDYISEGDWIITDMANERYLCKPNIFEKTYERVE